MHMQTDMDGDPSVALLFQFGGTCIYDNGATSYEGTGLQHILFSLGKYFKEHSQSEILCVSTEYATFTRRKTWRSC
eukprot:3083797-Prorocentrum_lima.AAC.1